MEIKTNLAKAIPKSITGKVRLVVLPLLRVAGLSLSWLPNWLLLAAGCCPLVN